jgi:hypothetical protein
LGVLQPLHAPPPVLLYRQSDYERRAFSKLTFGPDVSPMALNYFTAYGKTHPGSIIFAAIMQSLEGLENTLGILLLKPDAVVFYENLA